MIAPTSNSLLSVAEALERLLAGVTPLAATEALDTFDAHRRVLAADQTSLLDVPPLDNTQMDGYAVRAADCTSGTAVLPVSQRIPAGTVGTPLAPGSAARIFTGASIPPGADAVVMQEQCVFDAATNRVTIHARPEPGAWIRRAGEDIRAGATILTAGTRLEAQHLGLAASVGLARLPVVRAPRVALFSTGDELTLPGEPLRPGAIYSSNRYTLNGLLRAAGCVVTDLGIVPDDREATRAALRAAAAGHDCIVTSGGVSVGDEDHIRPAVEAEGRLDLWQIAVKPGKPLAYGRVGEALFIGLPGNPVSSFVTFLIFVRPVLLRLQGVAGVAPQTLTLRADFDWAKPDRRQEYLRVRRNAQGGLDLFPNQGSGVLTSTVWGDGLVENPPGQAIKRGDPVRYLPFAALWS